MDGSGWSLYHTKVYIMEYGHRIMTLALYTPVLVSFTVVDLVWTEFELLSYLEMCLITLVS